MFEIIKKDSKSRARLGLLKTPHGIIKTPSYVIVATRGEVKTLRPADIKKTKTQVVIANTYHLWGKPSVHRILGVKMPVMTDSGGFQVFSLAYGKNKIGKVLGGFASKLGKTSQRTKGNLKITEKGVYFYLGDKSANRRRFLSPEISMKIQAKLGADIVFAFDQPTSPLDPYTYNKRAMERTHRWAKRCLAAHQKKDQALFGIIQGGTYKDLRIASAKFISSLPFDGIGIGGSYSKKEITKVLKWIHPYLPEHKPRHLLGIGRVEDIFTAVENGMDLFDCVIPTREARHGRIYTHAGHFDISKYQNKDVVIEKGCDCPVCREKITRKKLDQRHATIHNVWFFNTLLENIRKAIRENRFSQFKRQFLGPFLER